MTETFSQKHLDDTVYRNLANGAVLLDPELVQLSTEIGFKLDPEYEPNNVSFSINPNLVQFLQGYHGFMMFEGHTSHSLEEDIYFAIDNYPIDIDPQEQQRLLDIQQTTSTSEQNFSVKLSPEQIAKIAIIATNLKFDWSDALNLMIAHLKEKRQKDPELINRINEALTQLSKGPFSLPSIN